MKTFSLAAPLLAAAFSTQALAQQTYAIDPSNVPNATRNEWCTNQKTSCPLICLQQPGSTGITLNTCDPDALQFQCICNNGLSPNVTEYSQTLPYFICTEWGNECVSNCGNNNLCAADCRQKHPCGAQAPTRVNISTSTATPSKTASASTSVATTIYTGLAGVNPAVSTGGAMATKPMRIQMGQEWGMAALLGGLFAGFAML